MSRTIFIFSLCGLRSSSLVDESELWQNDSAADSKKERLKRERPSKGELMAQDVLGISMQQRIDRMFALDRLWAWGFVIALWVVVIFVLLEAIPYASAAVSTVSWIAAIVLLVFNTGSIFNMVRHYSHDKERIYGTDIRHLDAGK